MIGYSSMAWNAVMWLVALGFIVLFAEIWWQWQHHQPPKESHNQLMKEIRKHDGDQDH